MQKLIRAFSPNVGGLMPQNKGINGTKNVAMIFSTTTPKMEL